MSIHNEVDAEIINGLRSSGIQRQLSEKKIFEQFFYMVSVARSKHKLNEEECFSAYSDTIISLIENIVSGRFEGRSSLKTYVHQIFMNKCVDAVRKKSTNKTVYDSDMIEDLTSQLPDKARNVVQHLIDKANRIDLAKQIGQLGEKCRQLLILFEDGYSDKQIAEQMAYNSADVVKTSRLRCLEKIRDKIRSGWYE
jgi:RNA polymerase sigma factor (sigma-70 family)